jgi:hypothetical protein
MPVQLLACLLCLPGQADAAVEELIAAHEATMAKIESIAIEFESYQCEPGKPPRLDRRYAWASDGQRTRRQFALKDTTFPDRSPLRDVCGDMFSNGQMNRMLLNWDDQRKRAAEDARGVWATISVPPAPSHPWFVDGNVMLVQTIQVNTLDKTWNAGEFIRAAGNVKMLPHARENGIELIGVSMDHPDTAKKGKWNGVKSTLYFHSGHGMLIWKQVHDLPAAPGATAPIRYELVVVRADEIAPGIVLPVHVRRAIHARQSQGQAQNLVWENTLRACNIAVNEQVPERAFDFRFPAGTIVTDMSQTGVLLQHRWGADNRPVETWAVVPSKPWEFPDMAFFQFIAGAAAVVAFVCAFTVYFLRRWRKQRDPASASA